MKNGLLWGVLAVVIIGGGIWWMGSKTPAKQPATTDSNTQTSTTGTQQTSIKALMAAGSPVSCKVATSATDTSTVYVSGTKMRADYTASGTTGHMINDGSFVYIWSEGIAQGFKMAANALAPNSTSGSSTVSSAPDVNAEQSLDCSPWTVTAASFTPPTNVTFGALPTGAGTNTPLGGY